MGVVGLSHSPRRLTPTRVRQAVGLLYGIGNVVAVVLFALSWLLRRGQPRHVPTTGAFILALLGALIAIDTGWLGGELVDRIGSRL